MNLILHAGHHKTGTTTFQKLLATHKTKLLEWDVFVPVVSGTANMGVDVVYPAQRGDWTRYEAILTEAKSVLSNSGTLLFSAEDLENCLFDAGFARNFMTLARSNGFDSIMWVFVQRNQFEYFESLYSELSKHEQIIRYDALANSVLKDGFYTCVSSKFRWFFIFDYTRAIDRFRKTITDNVMVLPFSEFVAEPIGLPIFATFNKALEYKGLVTGSRIPPQNERLSPAAVELRYLANFLGRLNVGSLDEALRVQLNKIARQRMEFIEGHRPRVRELFHARFSAVGGAHS